VATNPRFGVAGITAGSGTLKIRWWVGILLLGNVALYLWASGVRTVPDSVVPPTQPDLRPSQLRLYAAPVITAQQDYCLRVGPFISKTKAVFSRTLLTTLGVRTVALEASPDRRIKAYRIFMGPFQSRRARVAIRDHLNSLGIYDLYFIRESDGTLLISLGLFTQKNGAFRFLQKLREQGLQASLRKEMRSLGGSYWLLLTGLDERKVSDRNWSDPRARLHRVICPETGKVSQLAPGQTLFRDFLSPRKGFNRSFSDLRKSSANRAAVSG